MRICENRFLLPILYGKQMGTYERTQQSIDDFDEKIDQIADINHSNNKQQT